MPNDVHLVLMADSGSVLDVCDTREIAEVFVGLYRICSPWAKTKIERQPVRDQWDADMHARYNAKAERADL